MTKHTGLIRVQVADQVWFDIPGYTEVIFKRLIIHADQEITGIGEGGSGLKRYDRSEVLRKDRDES